jgi:hypothetical protein
MNVCAGAQLVGTISEHFTPPGAPFAYRPAELLSFCRVRSA